jgi:hypothetical protein
MVKMMPMIIKNHRARVLRVYVSACVRVRVRMRNESSYHALGSHVHTRVRDSACRWSGMRAPSTQPHPPPPPTHPPRRTQYLVNSTQHTNTFPHTPSLPRVGRRHFARECPHAFKQSTFIMWAARGQHQHHHHLPSPPPPPHQRHLPPPTIQIVTTFGALAQPQSARCQAHPSQAARLTRPHSLFLRQPASQPAS